MEDEDDQKDEAADRSTERITADVPTDIHVGGRLVVGADDFEEKPPKGIADTAGPGVVAAVTERYVP